MHFLRQICRQSALHQRRTGNHPKAQRVSRLEQGDELAAQRLRGQTRGLGHGETDWQLHGAKVVRGAAHVSSERHQLRQRQVLAMIRRHAQSQPGCVVGSR